MKRPLIAFGICVTIISFTISRAFAQAAGVPADPLADPATSVGIVERLWRGGAITSASILAAFMLLVVLRARVPWFSSGWRAVWCSAAIGGLGFLVDLIQSGATPNVSMMIVALTTTVALALQPRPAPPASTAVKP